MTEYTTLLEEYETMPDALRAVQLDELDALWCDIVGHYHGYLFCVPIDREPRPLDCHAARLILRPFPQWKEKEKAAERSSDARGHLDACEDCRKWDQAGRPYTFDMSWNTDRDVLCALMVAALQHPADWPQSHAVATRHSIYCNDCRHWQVRAEANSTCEATRRFLPRGQRRLAYFVETGPASITDNHVASCPDCQDWCLRSVSCEQTRDIVGRVVSGNEGEWKFYRHDTLAPREKYHILRCARCRGWILRNVTEDVFSAPIFRAMDGLAADAETEAWATDAQRTIRSAMTQALSDTGEIESWLSGIKIDPRGRETPIKEADFSLRTTVCLTKAGYRVLGDLVGKTDENLLAVRNIGRKSLREIRAFLKAYGLEPDVT